MNIKQALKLKNKLVGNIKECYTVIQTQNSIEKGNPRRYSVKDKMDEVMKYTNELVEIKRQIHNANQPVFEKIFLMAELKGMVKELKKMSVDEGKQSDRYSMNTSEKEVEMTIVERDKRIKDLEETIERLQDELDTFNATTPI
jgi:hypothetical protein